MKKLFFIVLAGFLLSGCFGNSLPDCDSDDAKKTLQQAIENALRGNLQLIKLSDVKELGFNKQSEIRVCKAKVLLSDGDEDEIVYNISWQDKKKSMFWIEIK